MSEDYWNFYNERARTVKNDFEILNGLCETGFKSMWFIEQRLGEILKARGMKLPPFQSFVWAYFRRNILYLQSAHAILCIGFYSPSKNLQRTVYETILRGYLFLADHEEADSYYSNLGTNKEEQFMYRRKHYGHSFLVKKLYGPDSRDKHRLLYRELCISSHAELKGLLLDFPKYHRNSTEDLLKMLLSFMYGNIQMLGEDFLDLLDSGLKNIMRTILKEIAETLKNIPLFEPNNSLYSSKIKLKKGNFLEILR